ncbi:MAG: GNAT family N-acetyltransferase [Deltaproteobacteria bacterium]|nr:GNAT family N-acetyltransferase [Deltaproteobacteria bacterium]
MQFHSATTADCACVYRWRTDPRTTRHFFDQREIAWETHCTWFERVLQDPDDSILLAATENEQVGVIRLTCFTEVECRCGQVGLYMNPDLHGRGLGKQMLTHFTQDWCPRMAPDVTRLFGKVALANIASQRCFLAAGYHAAAERVWGARDIREIARLLCAPTPPPPTAWLPPSGQTCDHCVYVCERTPTPTTNK